MILSNSFTDHILKALVLCELWDQKYRGEGGLNHRTRLEANKMVWAGGDGQLWSCDHRGTSGTDWLNFHFHPTLEFELTWLFYTQGWYQAHTCYLTLRCYRGSQGKVGVLLVHGYTITTYCWHSSLTFSSPREGTNSIGSLRTSDIIFFWWHERRIYSGLMWQCKGDNCSKSSFCSPSPKLQLPVPSIHQ